MSETITSFLDTHYKEYSLYTIEDRALPSVIDGLKPVGRKVIHISEKVWKTGNEKAMKVFQLSGKVASDAYYHHGSASLDKAIIVMAQSFKNSMPLLEEDGQFGSLRSPKPGAARYIGTKLSKNFRLLYKDFDLLKPKFEEGYEIEPDFFLPIIPTVLLNGSMGMSVGFATNILNRHPLELTEATINVLKDKEIVLLKPYVKGFNGDYIFDNERNRWIIRGKVTKINTTTVKITELPPSMTYENYENILDELMDKKIINNYDDNCKDDINYIVKFSREDLANYDELKLISLLKLEEYETDNFTTLDEFGKIKIFENINEILNYFVNFRLTYYVKRKEFNLNKLRDELKVLANKGKFIKAILDNKLEIKNKPKNIIIENIINLKLDQIDDSYDYLLRMPIYSLTQELFEKLKLDYTAKKEEIVVLENTEPKTMYLNDLNTLKKNLK